MHLYIHYSFEDYFDVVLFSNFFDGLPGHPQISIGQARPPLISLPLTFPRILSNLVKHRKPYIGNQKVSPSLSSSLPKPEHQP